MHRFKDCKMKYDKSLRYLHLTKERQPDIKYEKTLIDVAVIQNQKKGYNEDKTLKNPKQSNEKNSYINAKIRPVKKGLRI